MVAKLLGQGLNVNTFVISDAIDLGLDAGTVDERTDQLNFILNNIPEAVIVTNQDGPPVFNNRAANEFFGEELGDFSPEMWAERYGLFLDDEKTYFPSRSLPLVRALNGEPVQGEEMLLHTEKSQDTRYITMDARPLRDESGELSGAIVIIRDITYRKKIELSREKQARRAEALYTVSRLIVETGNDLPQIMNAVVVHTANIIGDACIATLVDAEVKSEKRKIKKRETEIMERETEIMERGRVRNSS